MGTVLLSGCWDTHLSGQTKAKALVEKRFQGQIAHRSCYAHLRAQNCCCCSHENLWLGCRYYVDNGGFCKWNAYKLHVHGIRGIPMYTNACRIPYTHIYPFFLQSLGLKAQKDTERRLCGCHPERLHLLRLGSYRLFVGCHGLSRRPPVESPKFPRSVK